MSARAGVRMTLLDLELDKWDTMQKRFRLTGCSLTGWQDAMGMIGANREQEKFILESLRKAARKENYKLCKRLRIPESLFVTCIKPEGTLSQVSGGVSQGIHFSYSPKFIRRIRINSADPLALAIKEMGWHLEPEIGTPGETYEERMKNARTLVAEFYIDSKADKSRGDVPALEQFEIYKMFKKHYTDMNTSNTITVKKDEWIDLFEQIYKDWNNYVGVSFLSLDENTYPLAPFEAIDDKKYEDGIKYGNKPFDMDIVAKYDRDLYSEELDETVEGCEGGSCSIR